MDESAIITGLLSLAGVCIGAAFTYLVSERSRRKDRGDIAQEETIDSLIELIDPLTRLRNRINSLGQASTKKEKIAKFQALRKVLIEFKIGYVNLIKPYVKMNRYVKKGPIHGHFSDLVHEIDDFSVQLLGFVESYDFKLKDSQAQKLFKQMDNRIQRILDVCREVQNALL